MKSVFFCLFSILLLSACTSIVARSVSQRAVNVPPGENGGPPITTPATPVVKVVSLATPTLGISTPDPSPETNLPTPASTSPALPKSLEELGFKVLTYQDTSGGFTFDYPAGWTVTALTEEQKKDSVIYSTSLRSPIPPKGFKRQDGVTPNEVAIDFSVIKNGPKTLDQAINERRDSALNDANGGTVKILAEEDWTLKGDLKAHRFLFDQGFDPVGKYEVHTSELVTLIQGNMILVDGSGDQSMFNVIAASLKALP